MQPVIAPRPGAADLTVFVQNDGLHPDLLQRAGGRQPGRAAAHDHDWNIQHPQLPGVITAQRRPFYHEGTVRLPLTIVTSDVNNYARDKPSKKVVSIRVIAVSRGPSSRSCAGLKKGYSMPSSSQVARRASSSRSSPRAIPSLSMASICPMNFSW